MNEISSAIIRQEDLKISTESFLNSCGNKFIHYSDKWVQFIVKLHQNISVDNIVYQNQGSVRALMRMAYIEDSRMGKVVNSLPFYGSHGGPILTPEYDFLQPKILKDFSDYCYDMDAISATLVESPNYSLNLGCLEELGFKCIDDRIGQITLLPKTNNPESIEDALFSRFHYKTRNAIRKGQKLIVHIEKSALEEDWLWLHQVHEESIKSLGGRSKPYKVFKILREVMEDSAQLYIAKLPISNIRVAGLLILKYNQTIEYFTPVVEPKYRGTQALSALIFEIMCQSAKSGFKYWNWGGTWRSQEGVYRFKSRWGAQDLPYRYFNRLKDSSIKKIDQKELSQSFPYFYTIKY